MRDTEQLLREEFGRDDAVLPLDQTEMLTRVRRVRRRRATITSITAGITALIVAGSLISTVLSRSGPDKAADPPAVIASPDPPGTTFSVVPAAIRFTDDRHGYSLRNRCVRSGSDPSPTPSAGSGTTGSPRRRTETCAGRLLATSDAGSTWEVRSVPELLKDISPIAVLHLWVLSQRTVVVSASNIDRSGGYRWVTVDGGRTWRQVPDTDLSGRVLSSIPTGSLLLGHDNSISAIGTSPRGTAGDSTESFLLVLMPDGTTGALGVPAGTIPTGDGIAATDGSIWAPCTMAGTGQACVLTSSNRGSTWTVIHQNDLGLPGTGTVSGNIDLSTANGHTIAFTAHHLSWGSGTGSGTPSATVGQDLVETPFLSRSTDGGRTWKAIRLPNFAIMSIEVLPSGDTVGTDMSGRQLALLPARETSFQALPTSPTVVTSAGLARTGPYLICSTSDVAASPTAYLSKDGTTWTVLNVP